MKTYLLLAKVYNYGTDIIEDEFKEMFSDFKRAKEYGLLFIIKKLSSYCKYSNKSLKQCIKDNLIDYDFRIVEEDIEYAEKFDKKIDILEEIENLLIYEPTHKEYILDYTGEITNICIKYLPNQREMIGHNHLYIKPNDLLENAGKKFKVGDIVKITKFNERDTDLSYYNYNNEAENIFVVRYLPRRKEGQKYLRNTYALSNIKNNGYAPGIYTWEYHEEQISLYDGEIKENSPIDVLRKIIKNEIKINEETWDRLKNGLISFREQDIKEDNYYKNILKLGGKENE